MTTWILGLFTTYSELAALAVIKSISDVARRRSMVAMKILFLFLFFVRFKETFSCRMYSSRVQGVSIETICNRLFINNTAATFFYDEYINRVHQCPSPPRTGSVSQLAATWMRARFIRND